MVPLTTSRSKLNITVKIYILRVSQDDFQKEDYWMDLTLRQFWTDPRFIINSFTYSDKVIMGGIDMTDLIWTPDTLVNDKMTLTTKKKRTIQHGDLLRLRTINGQVMLSQQIKTRTNKSSLVSQSGCLLEAHVPLGSQNPAGKGVQRYKNLANWRFGHYLA